MAIKKCAALIEHVVDGGVVGFCRFSESGEVVRDTQRVLAFVKPGTECDDDLQALLRCSFFHGGLVEEKKRQLREAHGNNFDVDAAIKAAETVDYRLFDKVANDGEREGVCRLGVPDRYILEHIQVRGVLPDGVQLGYAVGKMANLGVRVPEVTTEAPVVINTADVVVSKPRRPKVSRTDSDGNGRIPKSGKVVVVPKTRAFQAALDRLELRGLKLVKW